ncbi:MAG: hypothetical protein IT366_10035 [Candidatus Hydrogenedentes bacterium]|nr:hypothetical protein [Candidatus Hydrogenedentota bacterium]
MKHLLLALLTIPLVSAFAYDAAGAINPEAFKPSGERYEATVPATLDLAERARIAVHGLTSFLDPEKHFAPYGHVYFNGQPPYLSDFPGGPPNWGKIAEALLFARLMSGSEENLDVDAKSYEGMIADVPLNPTAPTPVSCTMAALVNLYQLDPRPELKRVIDTIAEDHVKSAQAQGDALYYYDGPPSTNPTALGVTNYWLQVFIQGRAIRPMTRWAVLSNQPKYLETSGGLSRFTVQPRFWESEAAPKAVTSGEHAQFNGHSHAHTQGLMGLLAYAQATNDARLKQFVRDGYEHMRSFGIARIGLFGEGCTTGDMTWLALALSRTGVGDYWDDADQYVRNHLAELQITDADRVRAAVAQMPQGRGKNDTTTGPYDPKTESNESAIEHCMGTFLSDSSHPTLIPEHNFLYTICCTGNCTPAMYLAWESIVQSDGEHATINLLLNRASPWLDVDSYLPYEGKVVIRNKTAQSVAIRIPGYVNASEVRAAVNGEARDPRFIGRYLSIENLQPKDEIVLTFPITTTTESYTLKWKQDEFWKECTDPGPEWKPLDPPAKYSFTIRANTVIDVSPRDAGKGLPLYLRDALKAPQAPVTTVKRFVAAKTVRVLPQ